MSNEAAADTPAPEPAESVEPAETVESLEATEPEKTERAPVVEEVRREVALQRSVRYGRVIVGGAALGAVVAAIAALFFPIEEGAEYTMAQAVGFFAVLGAAIGLGLGGLAALVLGLVARRQRGTGVAIQSDVR